MKKEQLYNLFWACSAFSQSQGLVLLRAMGKSCICKASLPHHSWRQAVLAALHPLKCFNFRTPNSPPGVRFSNSFGQTSDDPSCAVFLSCVLVSNPSLHHLGSPSVSRVTAAWVPRPDHHADVGRVKLLASSGASRRCVLLPTR